jgi:hypothetical protein
MEKDVTQSPSYNRGLGGSSKSYLLSHEVHTIDGEIFRDLAYGGLGGPLGHPAAHFTAHPTAHPTTATHMCKMTRPIKLVRITNGMNAELAKVCAAYQVLS